MGKYVVCSHILLQRYLEDILTQIKLRYIALACWHGKYSLESYPSQCALMMQILLVGFAVVKDLIFLLRYLNFTKKLSTCAGMLIHCQDLLQKIYIWLWRKCLSYF